MKRGRGGKGGGGEEGGGGLEEVLGLGTFDLGEGRKCDEGLVVGWGVE